MGAQRGKDAPGGEDPHNLVRPRRQHAGLGEAFQPDHEHVASRGARGSSDPTRQPAAAGQNAERRPGHAQPPIRRGSGRDGWGRR